MTFIFFHFLLLTAHQGLEIYYFIFQSIQSIAPQTAQWGGPGPRFEPGMGDLEAGTPTRLPIDHYSLNGPSQLTLDDL